MLEILIARGTSLLVSGTGLVLVALGIYMAAKAIATGFKCTESIQAKVLAFASNGSTSAPRIQYEVHGITYTKQSQTSSSHHSIKEGDEITVYYNPFNPDEMRFSLRHDSGQWLAPFILLVLGGFCLYFGIMLFDAEVTIVGILSDGISHL